MVITNKYASTLTLTASVVGPHVYCGTSHTLTFPRPTGFSTAITSDGDKFYFRLNDESTHLSINYEQEDSMRCSGNAVKLAA